MKTKSIDSLIRANVAALEPYSTARDEYEGEIGVFLDANESPFNNGYNRYPDPHQRQLKARIAELKDVQVENLFLGNGSDEAIDLLFRIFCEPRQDNVVAIAPSYGMYKVAAAMNDVELREVSLREDFSLPTDKLLAAADDNTKILFICSPNNPTANSFCRAEMLRLIDEFEGVVVVDEAYIDFADAESLKTEIEGRCNLVVLQTLSKAWAMAGLRVGLAIASERIVGLMSQMKYPYNINIATQQIAMQLLSYPIDEDLAEIKSQRAEVAEALRSMPFVRMVYPSDANFLLVKVDDADALYNHLIADKIIVRNRNRVKGCEGCLRISIGLHNENVKLIESLKRYEK